MIRLKEKYKGIILSKVTPIGTIYFDEKNVDPAFYKNYFDLGFQELFEIETVHQNPAPMKPVKNIKMNDYFDKIFCINLKRREDRWKESEKEFLRNGLKVERFEAIDSKERNVTPQNACTMSHIEILRHQILNKWNRILILEDDCQFNTNYNLEELNDFNTLIELVPTDWDMLYLGGNNVVKPQAINSYVSKVRKTYTTSSYGITLNAAKKALPHLHKLTAQIDVMYANEIQTTSNCYIFTPPLCWQRSGYSDIEEGIQSYDFMKS